MFYFIYIFHTGLHKNSWYLNIIKNRDVSDIVLMSAGIIKLYYQSPCMFVITYLSLVVLEILIMF